MNKELQNYWKSSLLLNLYVKIYNNFLGTQIIWDRQQTNYRVYFRKHLPRKVLIHLRVRYFKVQLYYQIKLTHDGLFEDDICQVIC